MSTSMDADLAKVLVDRESIGRRVCELGGMITQDFQAEGVREVTVICVTNGSVIFAADLLRHLNLYARLDCIRVSSYQDADQPVTDPAVLSQIRLDITDRDVLLLDDIFDTGKTLQALVHLFRDLGPRRLKTCVLLEKMGRSQARIRPDYVGFHIPNEFVVGYGLDFAERYRNLPHIGVLRPELQNPPEWA